MASKTQDNDGPLMRGVHHLALCTDDIKKTT